MTSIAIVIPYFGKWPDWMGYFVASCRSNPKVNWIIFTDCGALEDLPSNVELIHISYSDYCELVSQKLGIAFNPQNPYKLCDIKPALGLIHEETVQNYDFWGFGDLDLVYGNLRSYFTEERLAKKDLFATHARRISGHLCLIRNVEDMRQAFKKVHSWETYFTTAQHVAFDEKAYSKIFLRHKNSPRWIRKLAACFDPWLKRAEFIEAYTTPDAKIAWMDGSTHYPKVWFWRHGVVTNELTGEREYPYFHFMVWKKNWGSLLPLNKARTWQDAFSISKDGFKLLVNSNDA